jgi:hypothetical protein
VLQTAPLVVPDTQLQALCAVLAAGLVGGLSIQDVGTVPTQLAQHEQQPADHQHTPVRCLLQTQPAPMQFPGHEDSGTNAVHMHSPGVVQS